MAKQKKDEDSLEQASRGGGKICVKEGGGFLYQLLLNQKLDYSPDEVYRVLTDPKAIDVFRSIKSCTYRKTLSDDKQGRRKLSVGHKAIARFLFLNITFDTQLLVWEDDIARTIKFQNAQEGFMKKFDGSWHVQPYSRQAVGGSNQSTSHSGQSYPLSWLAAAQRFAPVSPQSSSSWISLEQSILPRAPAPPGVKQLIKGLCAKQLQNMVEDLDSELKRRRRQGGSTSTASKGNTKSGGAVSVASITTSGQQRRLSDLWEHSCPLLNITIKL